MTADNPAARADLDATLTEAEREALVLAFIEGWMAEVDDDDAEYLRTNETTRETAALYAEVAAPAFERILADRLAPLLAEVRDAREAVGQHSPGETCEEADERAADNWRRAETAEAERDEARAERAKAWDEGYCHAAESICDDRPSSSQDNPYLTALADPEAS
jgi:hypothetical protein